MVMLAVVVAVPLTEELLFRGLMMRGLSRHFGTATGAVLTSVVFASLHPQLPFGFFNLFATGMVLAMVYRATNSLVPCFIVHALNNGAAMLAVACLARVFADDPELRAGEVRRAGVHVGELLRHRALRHQENRLGGARVEPLRGAYTPVVEQRPGNCGVARVSRPPRTRRKPAACSKALGPRRGTFLRAARSGNGPCSSRWATRFAASCGPSPDT